MYNSFLKEVEKIRPNALSEEHKIIKNTNSESDYNAYLKSEMQKCSDALKEIKQNMLKQNMLKQNMLKQNIS